MYFDNNFKGQFIPELQWNVVYCPVQFLYDSRWVNFQPIHLNGLQLHRITQKSHASTSFQKCTAPNHMVLWYNESW